MVLIVARHSLRQQMTIDLYETSQPTVSRTWWYLIALLGQVIALDRNHLAEVAVRLGGALVDG